MTVIAHKHSPMLGGIRIFANFFGDLLTQSRPFGKPFPAKTSDWMPSKFDCAQRRIDCGYVRRYRIRLGTETKGFLNVYFALDGLFFPQLQSFLPTKPPVRP